MRILHISAECFPAAKVGGLGDVVGALPKYLNSQSVSAAVVMPKYATSWITQQEFTTLHNGLLDLPTGYLPYSIEQVIESDLSFPLFLVQVKDLFDREGIYSDPETGWYPDDTERRIYFQRAVLQWLLELPELPEVLHCHDHHSGLIPFMVQHCPEFDLLKNIPTVFTIHNGAYHGTFEEIQLDDWLPPFYPSAAELLRWDDAINPLVTGIRTCQKLTTVSPTYLKELQEGKYGLDRLLAMMRHKSEGLLNGIDNQVWDPTEDPYIAEKLGSELALFKARNKQWLCDHFNLDPSLPLITFIGRLVREKGADLLPELISRFLYFKLSANFIVLGTGEPGLEEQFEKMQVYFRSNFATLIQYNEAMAHQLYAGSDFLLMPSRLEPCGLNQLYAFRYGTIPIVYSTGGLKDTVIDISLPDGRGIQFNQFTSGEAFKALTRATELYSNKNVFDHVRNRIFKLDFSWERSLQEYIRIYESLTNL